MTITATVPKNSYIAAGGDTFTYTFKLTAASDMEVYYNGTLIIVGFTITGVGEETGGSVIFTPAPPNGTKIILHRKTTRSQATDWNANDPDPAESKENAFDKSMGVDQEQDEILSRVPQYKIDNSAILEPRIDTPVVGLFAQAKDAAGNVGWAGISTSGVLSNPVTLTQGGTGVNAASQAALAQALGLALWATGGDLASAATLPLPNPLTADRYRVTGAVNVTALATIGIADGTVVWLTFTSSPLFTHSANLQLMGATDYQAGSADIIAFQMGSSSTIWREVARIINPVVGNFMRFWRGDGTWQTPGYSRVMGFIGANNAGTPNSQYDLSAAGIVFLNPTDGALMMKHNQGVLTNNVLTAGPAANGRDQAGAFGAGNWLHFYFIIKRDGTVATVSSLTAPPTGPVLPSGYVAWAYACTVRYNATPILVGVIFRGSSCRRVSIDSIRALSAGASGVEAAINLTTFVPPNALKIQAIVTLTNTVTAGANANVYETTGGSGYAHVIYCPVIGLFNTLEISAINLGQNLYYLNSAANGQVYLDIIGYTVPNGGE